MVRWYIMETCSPAEAIEDAAGRQISETCGMVDRGEAETEADARDQVAKTMQRRCVLRASVAMLTDSTEQGYTATLTEAPNGQRKVTFRASYTVEV